jgi:hypothetical protein
MSDAAPTLIEWHKTKEEYFRNLSKSVPSMAGMADHHKRWFSDAFEMIAELRILTTWIGAKIDDEDRATRIASRLSSPSSLIHKLQADNLRTLIAPALALLHRIDGEGS